MCLPEYAGVTVMLSIKDYTAQRSQSGDVPVMVGEWSHLTAEI